MNVSTVRTVSGVLLSDLLVATDCGVGTTAMVSNAENANPAEAAANGLALFRRLQRSDLKASMRARGDPAFGLHLEAIRRTAEVQPIPDEMIAGLAQISAEDVALDSGWAFAPIAVLGQAERDALNASQMLAFAEVHGRTLVKWRLELNKASASAMCLSEDERDRLYGQEPGLWGYFVRGAPAHLTQNVNVEKALSNGASCSMEELCFEPNALGADVARELEEEGHRVVTLPDGVVPSAMVVRITDEVWEGFRTDAGQERRTETVAPRSAEGYGAGVLVVVMKGKRADDRSLQSVWAANLGLPVKVLVDTLPIMAGFAITDYRVQGQTLDKMVLSVAPRSFGRRVEMRSLYVLLSRVRSSDGLRVLHLPEGGLQLQTLRHTQALHTWEHGYDERGCWSPRLGREAASEWAEMSAGKAVRAPSKRAAQKRESARARARAAEAVAEAKRARRAARAAPAGPGRGAAEKAARGAEAAAAESLAAGAALAFNVQAEMVKFERGKHRGFAQHGVKDGKGGVRPASDRFLKASLKSLGKQVRQADAAGKEAVRLKGVAALCGVDASSTAQDTSPGAVFRPDAPPAARAGRTSAGRAARRAGRAAAQPVARPSPHVESALTGWRGAEQGAEQGPGWFDAWWRCVPLETRQRQRAGAEPPAHARAERARAHAHSTTRTAGSASNTRGSMPDTAKSKKRITHAAACRSTRRSRATPRTARRAAAGTARKRASARACVMPRARR